MTNTNRLWKVLAALMVVSFGILLYFGREIYVSAPPIPAAVQDDDRRDAVHARAVRHRAGRSGRRIGGQQMGSIWGHGSYVAPDWSADWLHREATGCSTSGRTRDTGKAYADLDADAAGRLQARLADGDAHQHLRPGDGRDHGRRGPRAGDPRRWPTTTCACSAPTSS